MGIQYLGLPFMVLICLFKNVYSILIENFQKLKRPALKIKFSEFRESVFHCKVSLRLIS